jgi:enoyl-CoA hydratase/carnithine racemase
MSQELVLSTTTDNGVCHLTLNRPDAYNALSQPLMTALSEALTAAGGNEDASVVVISGAGRGFCAGHDLKEVRGLVTVDEKRALFAQCSALMMQIQNLPKPVIAQVHGIATAAGCQLVATCDLAVAAESTRFSTPGVNIGLFCSTPMVALSRAVPSKQSMEMLLTGEMQSAHRAIEIGLINRAVPDEVLGTETLALAEKISSKSPLVLKIGKEAFYAQKEMTTAEAYDYCSEVMTQNLLARDAEEGITAFVEKRAPVWSGK